MKRVLFLAHGIGEFDDSEVNKPWWQKVRVVLDQKVTKLVESPEINGAALRTAFDETVFVGLNYDDRMRELVATMTARDQEFVARLKGIKGLGALAPVFTGSKEKQNFLHTHVFDLLIYRTMPEHRGFIREDLKQEMREAFKLHGTAPETKYSVMAHSLGTVVMHDVLHELSANPREGVRLGSGFRLHNLFMIANTSALLRDGYDPRTSNVRPKLAEFEAGYVERYWDFAHKLDPVAQFFSFRSYMKDLKKELLKGFEFVTVDHFLEPNIHSYTHYLRDPRVHLRIFHGLYGEDVLPRQVIDQSDKEQKGGGVPDTLKGVKSGAQKLLQQEPRSLSTAIKRIVKFLKMIEEVRA